MAMKVESVQPLRGHALARELDISSAELLELMAELGFPQRSHLCMIDGDIADAVRSHLLTAAREDHVAPIVSLAERRRRVDPNSTTVDTVTTPLLTEPPLRPSLVAAVIATLAVAVLPIVISFDLLVWSSSDAHPVLALLLAAVLTAGQAVVGTKIWSRQPEAAEFSFGSLMLWRCLRHMWAEDRLARSTRLLGFDRWGNLTGSVRVGPERRVEILKEIATALEFKDPYALNHGKRVEAHVRRMAAAHGFSESEITSVCLAATLHDIGNIRVSNRILRKPESLTANERAAVEGHVVLGSVMLESLGNEDIVRAVRYHHERWDGRGYPDGLRGEEIPVFARMIAVAEAYDAMTSTRSYRDTLTRGRALAVLQAQAGLQFDPAIVRLFVQTLPLPLSARVPIIGTARQQWDRAVVPLKRMGAGSLAAVASAGAIALILGTSVIAPGTFGGRERRDVRDGRGSALPAATAERVTQTEIGPMRGFVVSTRPAEKAPTGPEGLVGDEVLGVRFHQIVGGTGGDVGPIGHSPETPGPDPGSETPGPGPENPGEQAPGNATGHDKDKDKGPGAASGNSGNATGHDKDKDRGPGAASGNSGNAAGHDKDKDKGPSAAVDKDGGESHLVEAPGSPPKGKTKKGGSSAGATNAGETDHPTEHPNDDRPGNGEGPKH